MPQFALYRNKDPATRARFPLLLDIQPDLLDPLATRVVVPISPAGAARSRSMHTLTPLLRFEGKEYLMLTTQLAGVAARDLGPIVGDLASDESSFMTGSELVIDGGYTAK